jgi:hypothetical protein
MLIDDKRALLRLHGRPEFAVRHDEFVEFHGHESALGLVIQARPLSATWLDLSDAQIEKRVLAGGGSEAKWWDSFRSATRCKPTLHGIASLPSWDKPTWALEAHRDGHFIAGIWTFPDFDRGDVSQTKVMPEFYSAAIHDFFTVVQSVLQPNEPPHAYEVTGTVSGATKLPFLKLSDLGGQYVRGSGPLTTDIVQLPVYEGTPGSQDWQQSAQALASALCGAWGQKAPA